MSLGVIVVLVFFVISVVMILPLFQLFLEYESPSVKQADYIVVLSGGSGERVEKAAALYKAGIAPKILCTGGPLYSTSVAALMQEELLRYGVPKDAILIEEKATSTFENAQFSLSILKENRAKSILVVTSLYHTRRSAWVFNTVFASSGIRFSIVGAEDGIVYRAWWRNKTMIELVLMETFKQIWYRFYY